MCAPSNLTLLSSSHETPENVEHEVQYHPHVTLRQTRWKRKIVGLRNEEQKSRVGNGKFSRCCTLAIKIISRENVFSNCVTSTRRTVASVISFLHIYNFFSIAILCMPTCLCARRWLCAAEKSHSLVYTRNLYITQKPVRSHTHPTLTREWNKKHFFFFLFSSFSFTSCSAAFGLEFKTRLLVDFYTIFQTRMFFFWNLSFTSLFHRLPCLQSPADPRQFQIIFEIFRNEIWTRRGLK